MPRTPTPTMPYLVTRGWDGTTETPVARFVLLDPAREYCDWRVRPSGRRTGTIYSVGGQA